MNLIRGYFKLGGHHIQFNVINAQILREAQRASRKVQRPDCEGGGVQRLLLRLKPRLAG